MRSKNKLRKTNQIHTKKLGRYFAVCLILTLFGFVLVLSQNRIVKLANDVKELEAELATIEKRNDSLAVQIQNCKSPQALEDKVEYFGLKMVSTDRLEVYKVNLLGSQKLRRRNYFRGRDIYARGDAR
ncbi:MAG: hypothetical protein AAGA18_02845 [Verrucomicrobiota bacterium]